MIAVQVPKVRADRGVTGDALGTVLAGTPAGIDLEPQYTFCVGPRDK